MPGGIVNGVAPRSWSGCCFCSLTLWILIWAGKNIFYLFLWLLVGAFLSCRLLVFRCPRCGRFFALSPNIRAYSMKNRPTCIHCGLVVDTVPPAE